jgi:hypothetical protein
MVEERQLYLRANGVLSFEAPAGAPAEAAIESGARDHDDYVSDPAKPVPYFPRPITDDDWAEWQVADQRFVDGRPDVLTYESEPLKEDITVSGDPVAHLFAATSGSDSDWIVKLIDVYPEDYALDPTMKGFQLMIAGEVFRARYRNSFEKPEALVPGEVTAFNIALRDRDHTFKAGHRIMVQIQSSWFPLVDRNPQQFEDIPTAKASDFQKAIERVYHGGADGTRIDVLVME